MAGGAGDVWWSEELGDNLHQIYKLEKAIKREEDKLTTGQRSSFCPVLAERTMLAGAMSVAYIANRA
eukprot:2352501-Rhodomonas_salina.3